MVTGFSGVYFFIFQIFSKGIIGPIGKNSIVKWLLAKIAGININLMFFIEQISGTGFDVTPGYIDPV